MQQWSNMKARMGMFHQASPQVQAKQLKERVVAGRAGGVGNAPNTMSSLLFGGAEPNDKPMLESPEYIDPETRAVLKSERVQVTQDFANMMTNNSGDFNLKDLMEMGDRLAMQHPDQDGFIRNMLQTEMKRNTKLKNEADQYKLTGESESMGERGNEVVQGLPLPEQAMLKAQVATATRPGGFLHPDLAERLGFGEDTGVGYQMMGADKILRDVTPADIAARAQALFGLGGGVQPFAPTQPTGSGTITGADGRSVSVEGGKFTGFNAAQNSAAAEIMAMPGIRGVVKGPEGVNVQIQGGGVIHQKNVQEQIDILLGRGTESDKQFASTLQKVFGIEAKPTVPEIKTQKQAQDALKTIETSTAKKEGYIREDAYGNTIMWDPMERKWTKLINKEAREAIAQFGQGAKRVRNKVLKGAWDAVPIVNVAKQAGELSEKIERGTKEWLAANKKAADEAWKDQQ